MKCSMCGSEIAEANPLAVCAACQKLLDQAAAGSSGFSLRNKTIMPRAMAVAAAPNQFGREVWRAEGESAGNLNWPVSVVVRPAGDILVLDQPEDEYRVLRFDRTGGFLGQLFEITCGDDDGQVRDAKGICLDRSERIYIPDAGNDRIAVWDAQGHFQEFLGSSGRSLGQLKCPMDVFVDADDFVYVADTYNRRIQKFSQDGLTCLVVNGLSPQEPFSEPVAIAVDNEQQLYIADAKRNLVAKFSGEGELMERWPRSDSSPPLFDNPVDVRLDDSGAMYVSDQKNRRVQRFDAAGRLTGRVVVSCAEDMPFAGGDIDLLNEWVLIPDQFNSRLLCLAFAGLSPEVDS